MNYEGPVFHSCNSVPSTIETTRLLAWSHRNPSSSQRQTQDVTVSTVLLARRIRVGVLSTIYPETAWWRWTGTAGLRSCLFVSIVLCISCNIIVHFVPPGWMLIRVVGIHHYRIVYLTRYLLETSSWQLKLLKTIIVLLVGQILPYARVLKFTEIGRNCGGFLCLAYWLSQ